MSKKCIDCKNGIVKNTIYYKKALLIKGKKYKKVSKIMARLIKKIFHHYAEVINAYGEALCR